MKLKFSHVDIWEKVLIVLLFLHPQRITNRDDGKHNGFFLVVFCLCCLSIRIHVISFSGVVFRMTSQTKTVNKNETGMREQQQKKKIIFQFHPFLCMYHRRFVCAVVRMHCKIYLISGLYTQFIFYVFGIIIICKGIRNIVDWFTHFLLLHATNWNAFRKWNMIVYDKIDVKIFIFNVINYCVTVPNEDWHKGRTYSKGIEITRWMKTMTTNYDCNEFSLRRRSDLYLFRSHLHWIAEWCHFTLFDFSQQSRKVILSTYSKLDGFLSNHSFSKFKDFSSAESHQIADSVRKR